MMTCMVYSAKCQVDTSFVYRSGMPYGTLDIRIAKSLSRYYYLQENKTFSFRESSPGVRTENYRDMTSWDSSPYTQGNLREKNGSSDYFIMNYRLLFPQNYNATYSEGYPLILMVHGAGERGNCWDGGCYWADKTWKPLTNNPAAPTSANHELLNNDHNLLHGGQVHLSARNLAGNKLPNDPTLAARAFPGFVLFPQNLNGWDANSAQDVIRLVRLLTKKYNIDQNRIYIHGLSNGGYGVYEMIKRAPWMFACALPMSAVNDANINYPTYTSVLEDVSHIPLWIFQGGKDTNPTVSKTRSYVKKFQDAGMKVRYSEYANLGHGVWNDAYNEPDFFSWILSNNKANIHTFGNVPTICTTNGQGARMYVAKGFYQYQWEHNGVIIEGADSASFVATAPGVYRARFTRTANPSENDWNRWSEPVTVTVSTPTQAEFIQHGTLSLKDLNYYNDARLSAIGDFPHYYWYKDGVLVDLPGNQDDTTKNPVFKQGTCTNLPACTGNGFYTLVTAGYDNCPSPPSEGKQIFFNNQAPVVLDAPTSFNGEATGVTTAQMSWQDIADGETGYEIWRRKVLASNSFSRWEMAGLTNANETQFSDYGLDPSSTYQYKIRAVSNEGRSNYTPSASNQFLVIATETDNVAPTVPTNLNAGQTAIQEISISWTASSDDTGIQGYNVFFNDDTVTVQGNRTSAVLSNLELNTEYTIFVKAVDLGGNESEPSQEVTADTYLTGLYYETSTGGWNDLDVIDWTQAEYKGKVNNFTLAPRTQEDYFNFKFTGYLHINRGGTYQFRTTSDDGSRLTLNNAMIVNNDGLHGNVTITSASQSLDKGPHLVEVKYFEYTGGQTLTVQYKGPDSWNSWINIPDAALKSGDKNSLASARASMFKQPDSEPEVNIYPNPVNATDDILVTMVGGNNRESRVSLVSPFGERMFDRSVSADDLNEGIKVQPTKKLRRGFYILLVQHGRKTIRKIVVVRD